MEELPLQTHIQGSQCADPKPPLPYSALINAHATDPTRGRSGDLSFSICRASGLGLREIY
ncbi:hypothetical protein K458DRAFT_419259 [Lentithecium fluviatile CBS 122367]|uniref:Uncharacterized protein n=1 Tax=Lentithecium fluviatile CBS 122367 TaxID=1168545 RepID=A0A6G1IXQ8_9PLEO|nr:hypothetical protein K458DRAFT_419259 [Lentithecium fluviatile CBS 122367]